MKKLLFTSMLLGGLCGAGLAQAQAVVGGAVVVGDRHSNVGIYYQQPPAYMPVYYPRPRPVYYAQPVYYGSPAYYPRDYRWYGPPRRHHHHHDRYYDRYGY
ncbi:MAG: hypothetical protein KGL40_10640 [Rhodocyclaceae bacterium]|nr:hypothetical protein [Rhodocyclaceae bacterium]